jgi:hypothetical protein
VDDGVDLVDVAVHASLGYHLTGDLFGFGGMDLEQGSQLFETYVVVEFARRQEVVFDDGAVQDGRAVDGAGFLVGLQRK